MKFRYVIQRVRTRSCGRSRSASCSAPVVEAEPFARPLVALDRRVAVGGSHPCWLPCASGRDRSGSGSSSEARPATPFVFQVADALAERLSLSALLEHHRGNVSRVAHALGTSRSQVRRLATR